MPSTMEMMGIARRVESIRDPELKRLVTDVFTLVNDIHLFDYTRAYLFLMSLVIMTIEFVAMVITARNIIAGLGMLLAIIATFFATRAICVYLTGRIEVKHQKIRELVRKDWRYLEALRELNKINPYAQRYTARHVTG